MAELFCRFCAGEMEIDEVSGVSTHVGDGPGGVDHDADADHTAVSDVEV